MCGSVSSVAPRDTRPIHIFSLSDRPVVARRLVLRASPWSARVSLTLDPRLRGMVCLAAREQDEQEGYENEFDVSRHDTIGSSEGPETPKLSEDVADGPAAAASGTQFGSASKAAEHGGREGQEERTRRARSLSTGNDKAKSTSSTFFNSMRRRSTMHANSSNWGMGLVDGDDYGFQVRPFSTSRNEFFSTSQAPSPTSRLSGNRANSGMVIHARTNSDSGAEPVPSA